MVLGGIAPVQLLLDVLCHCGIGANAVALHQADQVPLRQAWRGLGGSLEHAEAQLSRHGQIRAATQAKLCLRKLLHACCPVSYMTWDSSCRLSSFP